MALCNDSKLYVEKGRVQRSGLPTEAALKVLNEKIGNFDPEFRTKPVLEAVEQYNEYLIKNFHKFATF